MGNFSNSFMPIVLKLTGVFVMVGRCAYGLDIILRLFFVTFPNFELSHVSVLNTIKVYA